MVRVACGAEFCAEALKALDVHKKQVQQGLADHDARIAWVDFKHQMQELMQAM